uniref:M16C_associated domain-containing protein n=1 Tax=Macrostomum lignano TaxID=282301 RepID=A0A1I8FQI1_9PLAT
LKPHSWALHCNNARKHPESGRSLVRTPQRSLGSRRSASRASSSVGAGCKRLPAAWRSAGRCRPSVLTLEELVGTRPPAGRLVHSGLARTLTRLRHPAADIRDEQHGAPHSLKHSVLCGSAKYPNPADLYNLFSVYWTPCFTKPLAAAGWTLLQGWRSSRCQLLQEPQVSITIRAWCSKRDEGVFSDRRSCSLNGDPARSLRARRALRGSNLRGFPGAIRSFSHGAGCLQFHRRHLPPVQPTCSPTAACRWPSLASWTASAWRFAHRLLRHGVPLRAGLVQAARAAGVEGPLWNRFLPPDRQVQPWRESFLFGRRLPSRDNFHLALRVLPALRSPASAPPSPPSHGFSSDCRNTAFHIGLKGLARRVRAVPAASVSTNILAETVRSTWTPCCTRSSSASRDEGANFGLEKILALAGPANHGADLAELLAAEDLLEDLRRTLAEQPRYLQRPTPTSPLSGAKPKSSWLRRQRGPTRGRCHGWRLATCRDRRPVGATEWAVPDRLLLCPQPTNGLVYFRSPRPSTSSAAALACTPYATARPDEAASSCESGLVFSACCLAPNLPRVLQLWQEICAQPDWAARDRLANLLRMEAADLVSRPHRPGPRLRAGRAAARLSESSRVADLLTGLTACAPSSWPPAAEPAGFDALAEDLADLCRTAFRRENFCISLTGNRRLRPSWPALMSPTPQPQPSSRCQAAAARASTVGRRRHRNAPSGGLFEHFEVAPWGVNFCAQAFPCPAVTHRRSFPPPSCWPQRTPVPPATCTARSARSAAPTAAAPAHPPPRLLLHVLPRPASLATLDSFAASAEWLAGRVDSLTDSDLEEAKLAVFKTPRHGRCRPRSVRQARPPRRSGSQQKTHKVIIGCRNLEAGLQAVDQLAHRLTARPLIGRLTVYLAGLRNTVPES